MYRYKTVGEKQTTLEIKCSYAGTAAPEEKVLGLSSRNMF